MGTIPAEMGTLQALLGRLDPDPLVRGRQFEHICKWFLETDPIYAPQLRSVRLWKDWPGRWGADAGIDLVAETTDGRLWAIQAKAYAPGYWIKKSDLDTFLSESSRTDFSYRLLIATTNHVGATARRTLEAQEKPAHLSLLGDLERAAVEWPSSPRRLIGRPAKPKTPRSHQKRAIGEVVAGLERHDRGQLIMACGTGKTLVALWLAEAMPSQRTLILVPSLSLLAQTLREWRASATRPFEALHIQHSHDLVYDLGRPGAGSQRRRQGGSSRPRGCCVGGLAFCPTVCKALAPSQLPAETVATSDVRSGET